MTRIPKQHSLGLLAVAFTLALAAHTQGQSFVTNRLVAYYPFVGNAKDASGHGNDGTPVGVTLTTDRFGTTANAYHFLGTASSYVQVGDRPLLRMTNAMTISAWVYQTETTNAQMIVSKEGEYWFGTYRSVPSDPSSHKLYVALGIGSSGVWYQYMLGNPPPLSKWTQVSLTYGGGQVAAYMNGILMTNFTTGATLGDGDPTRNDFRIGNRQLLQLGWNVEPFVGDIDDVRMYNRALSAAEIQQLFQIESGPRVTLLQKVQPSFSFLSLGTNYQLQVSADLTTWTNSGSPFTATSPAMVYPQEWQVDFWGQLFFRLQVAP